MGVVIYPVRTGTSQGSGALFYDSAALFPVIGAEGVLYVDASTSESYIWTGSGKYTPYMPLQGADGGIAQVNNVQISVSYVSGEFSIGLVKPLATLPITTLGVASERAWIANAERIYDGANLHWIINHGAATPVNSALWGHLDMVWTPA